MKRLLAALLLVASPALAQSNGWREAANGWGEIQSGTVPYTSPSTGTLDIRPGSLIANNLTVTALATPTVTSVTPTLTKIGSITTVAGASLVDGDYFTIKYAPGLTVPIEFDASPGNGTTGGRVPYVFAPGDTADQIRDGLITLLNAAAGTALTASSGGAATVALVLDTPGAAGDTNTENVANAGFAVTGFVNPTAATTYGYRVDSFLADGSSSGRSNEVTTAAGHATLSASNYNTVVFAPSAGSVSTRLYRTTGGTAPPRLLYTGTATSYVDTGAAGTAQTPATANTTGTLTGKFLDGTVTAPSIGIASMPGGFYKSSFSRTVYTNGTSGTVAFGDYLTLGQLGRLVWVDNNDPGIGTVDTILSRGAAATLQLGAANAASPVGQRLRSQGAATGTDIAGADLAIGPGNPTGTGLTFATGRNGALRLQTYAPGTTGTTASTQATDRFVMQTTPITLTESSATPVLDYAVASGTVAGGTVWYTIRANDATDFQSLRGQVQWSAVNKGGTLTASIGLVGTEVGAVSSGTLTNTPTITTGAGIITINLNAVSSLTQTTLYAHVSSQSDGTGLVTTK